MSDLIMASSQARDSFNLQSLYPTKENRPGALSSGRGGFTSKLKLSSSTPLGQKIQRRLQQSKSISDAYYTNPAGIGREGGRQTPTLPLKAKPDISLQLEDSVNRPTEEDLFKSSNAFQMLNSGGAQMAEELSDGFFENLQNGGVGKPNIFKTPTQDLSSKPVNSRYARAAHQARSQLSKQNPSEDHAVRLGKTRGGLLTFRGTQSVRNANLFHTTKHTSLAGMIRKADNFSMTEPIIWPRGVSEYKKSKSSERLSDNVNFNALNFLVEERRDKELKLKQNQIIIELEQKMHIFEDILVKRVKEIQSKVNQQIRVQMDFCDQTKDVVESLEYRVDCRLRDKYDRLKEKMNIKISNLQHQIQRIGDSVDHTPVSLNQGAEPQVSFIEFSDQSMSSPQKNCKSNLYKATGGSSSILFDEDGVKLMEQRLKKTQKKQQSQITQIQEHIKNMSSTYSMLLKNFSTNKSLTESMMEQLHLSIQDQTKFSDIEAKKLSEKLVSLEGKMADFREKDIPQIVVEKLLESQNDFVRQGLFKTKLSALTQQINDLQFELQSSEDNRKDKEALLTKSLMAKLESEMKKDLLSTVDESKEQLSSIDKKVKDIEKNMLSDSKKDDAHLKDMTSAMALTRIRLQEIDTRIDQIESKATKSIQLATEETTAAPTKVREVSTQVMKSSEHYSVERSKGRSGDRIPSKQDKINQSPLQRAAQKSLHDILQPKSTSKMKGLPIPDFHKVASHPSQVSPSKKPKQLEDTSTSKYESRFGISHHQKHQSVSDYKSKKKNMGTPSNPNTSNKKSVFGYESVDLGAVSEDQEEFKKNMPRVNLIGQESHIIEETHDDCQYSETESKMQGTATKKVDLSDVVIRFNDDQTNDPLKKQTEVSLFNQQEGRSGSCVYSPKKPLAQLERRQFPDNPNTRSQYQCPSDAALYSSKTQSVPRTMSCATNKSKKVDSNIAEVEQKATKLMDQSALMGTLHHPTTLEDSFLPMIHLTDHTVEDQQRDSPIKRMLPQDPTSNRPRDVSRDFRHVLKEGSSHDVRLENKASPTKPYPIDETAIRVTLVEASQAREQSQSRIQLKEIVSNSGRKLRSASRLSQASQQNSGRKQSSTSRQKYLSKNRPPSASGRNLMQSTGHNIISTIVSAKPNTGSAALLHRDTSRDSFRGGVPRGKPPSSRQDLSSRGDQVAETQGGDNPEEANEHLLQQTQDEQYENYNF